MSMRRSLLPSDPRERRLDLTLWAVAFSCAGATLFFSLDSYVPGANLFGSADKVEHAIAYGGKLLDHADDFNAADESTLERLI